MIKNIYLILILFSSAAPFQALAAIGRPPHNFKDFTDTIIDIVNMIIPVLVTLALIGFLWGMAQTILHSDSEEARKNGRKVAVYGILALFVMLSLWGILQMAYNTFF